MGGWSRLVGGRAGSKVGVAEWVGGSGRRVGRR